jgi:hypothetical protein
MPAAVGNQVVRDEPKHWKGTQSFDGHVDVYSLAFDSLLISKNGRLAGKGTLGGNEFIVKGSLKKD